MSSTARSRVDRAALLTGARSRVAAPAVNPLLPAASEAPDPFAPKPLDPAAVTGTAEERLAAFETAIDEAKETAATSLKAARARFVVEAGTALRAIRDEDGGLYKVTHDTFEEYIVGRWGMDRTRAYQLIDAAPAMLVMSKIFDTAPVESQARVMAPVIEAHGETAVREVVAAVKQSGEKVTAAALRAAAVRMHYIPEQPAAGPGAARTDDDPPAEHTPEQARALVRLEQGLAALRGAHRALRGRVIADALDADSERGKILAAQVRDLAGKIDRLTR
ncbi:hypothetical protein ABTY20_22850 [Streptomyces sp. NPDC126497]|uniref:hypothetical protein n=1 Tax=Streptomyces sp. NPDC126497 TaxID=3155313 RepID=UPI00332AEB81